MNIFQPVYIWAQALDNESDDDFYELNQQGIRFVPIEESQPIVSEMGRIANSNQSIFYKKFTEVFLNSQFNKGLERLSISPNRNKIFLQFNAEDKDRVGRASNIDVLLDITGIQNKDLPNYAKFFFEGLQEFAEKTNRHPISLMDETRFDNLEEILNKAISLSNNFGFKNSATDNDSKDSKYLIYTIIIIAVLIIGFFILKN